MRPAGHDALATGVGGIAAFGGRACRRPRFATERPLHTEQLEVVLAVSLRFQAGADRAEAEDAGSGSSAKDDQRPVGEESSEPAPQAPGPGLRQVESQLGEDRPLASAEVTEPTPKAEETPLAGPTASSKFEDTPEESHRAELEPSSDDRPPRAQPEVAVASPTTGAAVDAGGPAAPEHLADVPGPGTGTEGGSKTSRGGRRKRRGRQAPPEEPEVLPKHLFAPKPPYPSRSRDLGEEGTVIIAILVGEDGQVVDCRVASSSGHPLLDGSALSTVREKWRFKAGRSAGKPVARWVRVPVEFRISR